MFCPNCGTQCPDGERFCPSCGTALEENQPVLELDITPNQERTAAEGGRRKERRSGKKAPQLSPRIIGIAAVALAAVVVIVLAVSLLGGAGGGGYGDYTSKPILSLFDSSDSERIYYCGGKEIGAAETEYTLWNQDGSVGVFVNNDGELCVITAKGIDVVADDVGQYQLSANGAALLYITEDYDVCWYDVKKKSSTTLETGEDGAQLGQPAPDGSAAVFTLYDGGDYEGFTCGSNKKPVSMGEGLVPFAISNKGSYVYYLKVKSGSSSGTLYVSKGSKGEGEKLASDYYMNSVLFNKDATQMMFNNDGKTYLTVKGGEKNKVFSSSVYSMFAPDYTVGSSAGGVVPVSDLRGQTYYTSGGVYFLDSKGESKKITSDFDGFALSESGSNLIYLKKGDLVKVTNLAKGTEEDLTDEGDILSFQAAGDLSVVYYLNRDGELYYQKGSGKPVEVGDDVDSFLMVPNSKTCAGISDGQLFVTTGGKSTGTPHDLDDVTNFGVQRGVLLVCQDAGGGSVDIYTMSGADPKLLVEDFEGYID